mgnify:CR=1 FL=1
MNFAPCHTVNTKRRPSVLWSKTKVGVRAVIPGILLFCLGVSVVHAASSAYRWVDSAGQVHYSQTPPAKGPYRLLENPTPTVFSPDRKAMSDFLQASDQREAAAKAARELAEKKRVADAAQCEEGRKRLEVLESRPPRRFFLTGADGQPARMTDEQWETRKDRAQAMITQSCH